MGRKMSVKTFKNLGSIIRGVNDRYTSLAASLGFRNVWACHVPGEVLGKASVLSSDHPDLVQAVSRQGTSFVTAVQMV